MGLLTGATMRPQISLAGARIASRLSLNRAPLDAPTDGKALVADGATVGGSAVLTELRAHGEVGMRTASVGEGIMCSFCAQTSR